MNTVLAVITDSNKVLIGKLKSEKIKAYGNIEYVFQSAQSENQEEIKQNLIQEVKMQSDLDITIVDKIGERIHPVTQNLTEYYFCKKAPGQEVKLSKYADVEEFLWVDLQELPNYMPSLFEKVEEYLQIRHS